MGTEILSNFSKIDEYGFERPDNFDYKSYEEFLSVYLRVLIQRSKKWSEIFGDNRYIRRSSKLKKFVRSGIPSEHRGKIWMLVSGAEDLKNKMSSEFYLSLMSQQELNLETVETIRLDLPRTFPDNIYFKNPNHYQSQLYNILVSYAHHNTSVGYCQGLNFIAGLILIVTKCEETTFWLLKVLVEQILPDYYSTSLEGVIVDIQVLSELVKLKMPDLHQHISTLGLPWAVVTTKWLICLFAEVLPIETVLRIWDCLFYEGSKVIFRVCLTMFKLHKRKLMACKDFTELADCIKDMTKDEHVLHCHQFLKNIFKVPGSLSYTTIMKLRQKVAGERLVQKEEKLRRKMNNTRPGIDR